MTTKLMINGKEIPENLGGVIIFAVTGSEAWKYTRDDVEVLKKIAEKAGKSDVTIEDDGVKYETSAESLPSLFEARMTRKELGSFIRETVAVSGKPTKTKKAVKDNVNDLLALLD